jgi:hypothetical protein
MLGALQSAFREHAILRQSGDALTVEEVLRILGEWSDMIGYETDSSSPVWVYAATKVSPVQKFERGWKKWRGYRHGSSICQGSTMDVEFLGQSQTLGQKTWHAENYNLTWFLFFLFCFHSLLYQPLPWIALYWLVHFFTLFMPAPDWDRSFYLSIYIFSL